MEKKQTAVEWLDEQLQEAVISQDQVLRSMVIQISYEDYMSLKSKALQMEKEQITDAYWDGGQDVPTQGKQAEQYYNETYKKQ